MPSMFHVNWDDTVSTPSGEAFPGANTFKVVVSVPVPVLLLFWAFTRESTTSRRRTSPFEQTKVSTRPAGHDENVRLIASLFVLPL